MADAKLSELTAATTAASSDSMYLVQSNTSKKITVEDFFANVDTPAVFSDKIQIQDTNTQSAPGAIDPTTNITFLNNPDSGGNMSIGTGSDGQVKVIVMIGNSGGHTLTLTGSNVVGDVAFDAAGETAALSPAG